MFKTDYFINVIILNGMNCDKNKYSKEEYHILKALKHQFDNETCMSIIISCKTKLYQYNLLRHVTNPHPNIKEYMTKLLKQKEVMIFHNKLNMLSKTDECCVCMKITQLIPRECCHYYCADCYVKISDVPCPICHL